MDGAAGFGIVGEPPAVFWIILAIAVINIGLGFAVAAHLGARYRAVLAMIDVDQMPAPADNPPEAASEPAASDEQAPAPAGGEPVQEVLSVLGGEAEPPDSAGQAESTSEAAPEVDQHSADLEAEAAESDQTGAESPSSAEPREPREAMAAVESAAGEFEQKLSDFDEVLINSNERLRAQTQSPEAAAIEQCLASLREATVKYIEQRKQAETQLSNSQQAAAVEPGEGTDWQAAVAEQQQQIDQTVEASQSFDPEGDLPEQCREMVSRTDRLLDANHRVRGALEELRVDVARRGNLLDDASLTEQTDPLTGLHTRVALEAWLYNFWQDDTERTRQLCVGTIDIDEMEKINANYGRRTGDLLLRAVARLLQADESSALIARVGGQRFVLVFPDVESHAAVSSIERLRQTIELARFRHIEGDLRITVSGAVAEATPEDTSGSLLSRLDVTLQEAKRYGRNRTFVYEGRYPTPVVPPNFTLEEKEVSL